VAECARQRGDLADGLNLLKAPVERVQGATEFLRSHRKSVLAGAGVALGMLIARAKPGLAVPRSRPYFILSLFLAYLHAC